MSPLLNIISCIPSLPNHPQRVNTFPLLPPCVFTSRKRRSSFHTSLLMICLNIMNLPYIFIWTLWPFPHVSSGNWYCELLPAPLLALSGDFNGTLPKPHLSSTTRVPCTWYPISLCLSIFTTFCLHLFLFLWKESSLISKVATLLVVVGSYLGAFGSQSVPTLT
jgi:hypothetical protein